jgi:sec-independent protein translocase protein TatB
MFDFAWSELALIGVVALILIGPKDLPVAIKAVTDMVKKARAMAGEFRTHIDEMVREANLDEVRNSVNELRNFDINKIVEDSVDADGTIRKTFTDDPLNPSSGSAPEAATPSPPPPPPLPVGPAQETADGPPAFVPPQIVRPTEPPAFMPPGARAPRARV